jgi:hypothetical protein
MQVFQLFTELIALPSNAIGIKCYDFEGSMNLVAILLHEILNNFCFL